MGASKDPIQQVRELIKAGRRPQALKQVARLIEKDHDNPELWWLLANATDDTEQARAALDHLLVLQPNNERARRMLERVETRQFLRQMGVSSDAAVTRGRWLTLVIVGVILLIALGVVALLVAVTNREPPAAAVLPTSIVLPSLTPTFTETPTPTPTPTFTETPTPTATPTSTATPTFTETTAAQSLALNPEVTAEALAQNPEATGDVSPALLPTLDPTLVAGAGSSTGLDAAQAVTSLPGVAGSPLPSLATPLPVVERGQVTEVRPAQDIILPYAEHGWTFSGYRGEQITLELLNVTGRGNPSLILLDPRGTVIAEDVELIDTANRDARLSLALPEDGIYTAVVRIASVDEQLYYLTIKRG